MLSPGNVARGVWAAGKPRRRDRFPIRKKRGHHQKKTKNPRTEQMPARLKEPEVPEWKLGFQPQIRPARASMQSPSPAFSSDGNKLQFHPEVSSFLGLAQQGPAKHIPSLLPPLSSLLQLEVVRLQFKLQLCCSLSVTLGQASWSA